MSYSGKEPLEVIVRELKAKLPSLQKMLWRGEHISTLHGTVEMLLALIQRYERGEIIDKNDIIEKN